MDKRDCSGLAQDLIRAGELIGRYVHTGGGKVSRVRSVQLAGPGGGRRPRVEVAGVGPDGIWRLSADRARPAVPGPALVGADGTPTGERLAYH